MVIIKKKKKKKPYNRLLPHSSHNGHNKKKKKTSKCWRGCEEKGTPLQYLLEYKLIQPLWRTVWRFYKKLGIKLLFDPAISLLNMYLEKSIIQKEICTKCSLRAIYDSQDMDAT